MAGNFAGTEGLDAHICMKFSLSVKTVTNGWFQF